MRAVWSMYYFFTALLLLFLLSASVVRAFTVQRSSIPPASSSSACASASSSRLLHTTSSSVSTTATATTLSIGEEIGRGSYGIVHLCTMIVAGDDDDNDNELLLVGKRCYVLDELEVAAATSAGRGDNKKKTPKERLKRCQYYFHVEQHCMEKLSRGISCSSSSSCSPQTPTYRGIHLDADGNKWMTFDLISSNHNDNNDDDDDDDNNKMPCPTLQQVMDDDWKVQHDGQDHHLSVLEEALGLSPCPSDESSCFARVLDCVISSLVQVLSYLHNDAKIVHRDVKPANLLVDAKTHSLILIDFGSAADMEPIRAANTFWGGGAKRIGLEDGNRVAVSPIYSAPELFVDPQKAPFQFDVFSAALIVCQLLFNYLDERTDAGFHQQLEDANWDLDVWLSRELASKVRPAGLEEALEYLASRRGLWRLLGDMLRKNPEQRVSSKDALQRWQQLLLMSSSSSSVTSSSKNNDETTTMAEDGPFFESVVALMEECQVPPTVQRPLHFVATFRRNVPLGLVLSEVEPTCTDPKWIEATKNAEPGEVFVQSVLSGCQADQMGIFEVGDRLQGVGELPLGNRGFERVLKMLEEQPRGAKYVRLHFDRQAARRTEPSPSSNSDRAESHIKVVAQGAWSSKGRRKAQEDTFVLHEIHEEQDILLAGVFDGHGGTAASHAASQMVPYLMSETLRQQANHEIDGVRNALEAAWETTCDTYRHGCLEEECVANYDAVEGTLEANTGSTALVSGTTASLVAVQEGTMTVLNCGDSRSLLIDGTNGEVLFSTQDHTPDAEMDRLNSDPFYSTPKCSLSKWYLSIGDYQYAVARSLEGPFATSKGIVSDADVTSLSTMTEDGVVVMATDGLFEVMDNEEVGRDVVRFRARGDSAADAAKLLCSLALEKGSSDNVSVVVVYFGGVEES